MQSMFPSAMPPITQPYFDASVFLAHIKQETNICPDGQMRWQITAGLFEDARNGKFQIYTSTVTLAEVRRLKESSKTLTDDERTAVNELFGEFLEHEWLYPIDVTREIGLKAQEIGANHNLSPMDSIHLASAIVWDCNVFLAWDKNTILSKFPTGEYEGVLVREPFREGLTKMGPS